LKTKPNKKLLAIGLSGVLALSTVGAVVAQQRGGDAGNRPSATSMDNRGGPGGDHGPRDGGGLKVAADAIGIDVATLRTELQGGKTIAQVASAHNISAQTAIDKMVADANAHIDQAVKDGKLTAAQAATEKAEVVARVTKMVNELPPAGGSGGPGGPHGPREGAAGGLKVAADAIGIDQATLKAELQGGKTIGQVAAAHNVRAQTVIDKLVADPNAHIDQAVKDGKMTAAQAATEKAEVVARVTKMVNELPPAGGPGGHGPHGQGDPRRGGDSATTTNSGA
jgi:polyhydroxyalkanoate synthesis regulator phasin